MGNDARWGRVSETYGEDFYLVSAMSVAYTRGLQGKDLTKGVLATAKHFVGSVTGKTRTFKGEDRKFLSVATVGM